LSLRLTLLAAQDYYEHTFQWHLFNDIYKTICDGFVFLKFRTESTRWIQPITNNIKIFLKFWIPLIIYDLQVRLHICFISLKPLYHLLSSFIHISIKKTHNMFIFTVYEMHHTYKWFCEFHYISTSSPKVSVQDLFHKLFGLGIFCININYPLLRCYHCSKCIFLRQNTLQSNEISGKASWSKTKYFSSMSKFPR